ncbi:MAG: Bug family tripartite tricarboxylate transporter substrate binding protein [Pseudolabrys sp.]
MRKLATGLLLAFGLAAVAPAALADEFPNKPIRVITSSSAGGISDLFMRVLGDAMRPHLNNQPLIIENRPGAAGGIAARACQDAPPDGYTICILNVDTLAYNQYLFKTLNYDPENGLTPIVNLFHLIQVLVINADLKAKTVDELIAVSKEKKGTLSYLTAAIPLAAYMENLKRDKGADWVRVPFKGGGEATNAILAGTTPIGLIGLGNVIPQIQAGKMTALALVNNVRTPLLPNVPTLADTGYKGAASQTWYGLFAPAKTPKPLVDRINAEVRRVFADKDFVEKFVISRGQVPAVNTPEAFAAEIKANREAAQQVVKDSGLQAK